MGTVLESLSTINALTRTALAVLVVAAVGAAGWFGYTTVQSGQREVQQREAALADARERIETQGAQLEQMQQRLDRQDEAIAERDAQIEAQQRTIGDLRETVAEQVERIQKLDTALRLLKVDHRLARLTVLEQSTDPDTGEITSTVEFVEIDGRGRPIEAPRTFRVEGDVIYVDNWVVKFDDRYVEEADLERSTSLVLFRRLFGEHQEPRDGHVLDETGERPRAYGRSDHVSDFEKKIWQDFWTIANDPQRAAELGIRAAHGEAVSMKVREGGKYRLLLRASDGLSIVPES